MMFGMPETTAKGLNQEARETVHYISDRDRSDVISSQLDTTTSIHCFRCRRCWPSFYRTILWSGTAGSGRTAMDIFSRYVTFTIRVQI